MYDQSYKYTVSDLIGFDLVGHSQLIMSICDSAVAENALESHLKKLVKRWEEEEFKLAKYYQERRNLHNTDKSVGKTTKVLINTGSFSILYDMKMIVQSLCVGVLVFLLLREFTPPPG